MTWPIRKPNQYYNGPKSDHFDGVEFFNPHDPGLEPLLGQIRRSLTRRPKKWPSRYHPDYLYAHPPERVNGSRLLVTMVGHATVLIQTAGLNLLTDPIWADRCTPIPHFGPKRVSPPGVEFDDLPPVDAVLLTHNHYDHLNAETIRRIQDRDQPLFITSLGNDTILRSIHSDIEAKVGDWGDVIEGPEGLPIHIVRCHHWSGRGIMDKRHALWSSFVIEADGGPIFHVGDSAFAEGRDYQEVGETFGPLRQANLPIGAYMPRWYNEMQHQSPSEAAEGFRLCKAENAIAHHWATFQLTEEGLEDPRDDLNAALKEKGIEVDRFRALDPGEMVEVPELGSGVSKKLSTYRHSAERTEEAAE
ncbi:MBL fold metallo-hydrolase [Notoacmeibacter ruber]|uniref:Metallo-beta-lactamase domain-containing protein n=1 Tax=Notoacmeibacter ruber TaxID=2670375 RepID=A0A3L7JFJ4_9HYPH|nr:MBL fold metallo-hydrolase [Notoacmeibacter ruber]RLQ89095.1 hypothetical protein D8780_13435 [Notoacmeibacter ruber]